MGHSNPIQVKNYSRLTDKQSKFVDYFVAEGKTQTEAARLAGYSFPEYEGYRLVRQPRMIQFIQAARQKYYQTNLANVAVSTLQQVMQDQNAPQLPESVLLVLPWNWQGIWDPIQVMDPREVL